MSSAHEERESALVVLSVREEVATLRDFRCHCHGETSCRAELSELLQLLERRRADIAIFFSHSNLVYSLVEELRRRGKEVPEMVVAASAEDGQAHFTVSFPLSGLSEPVTPQEILMRLHEALRTAQGLVPEPAGVRLRPNPGKGSPREGANAQTEASAQSQDAQRKEDASLASSACLNQPVSSEAGEATACEAGSGADTPQKEADAGHSADPATPTAASRPTGAPPTALGDDGGESKGSELDELSARLERVLQQRLRHQSQP